MPTLSPLQTLPIHTIERIVDFVAINIRLKFGAVNPNTYFEECHILLMPLLGVCHIFRAVVYSRFSMRYRLAVDLEKAHGWPIPCTRCQKRLHNPFHLMAKEVMVSISPLTVFSGKALVALSRAPFNDISFPLARTLEVYFHNFMDDEEIPAASQDVEDNISVFVRRIWQMAPNINFVKLSGDLRSWDQDIIHVGALITRLVLSVSRIEFAWYVHTASCFLRVEAIRDLTYLGCDSNFDGEQIVQLIQQNAPTLQYLSVLLGGGVDYSPIIKDADGSYVEYSRLRTLVMKQEHCSRMPRRHVFDGAAPFPSLRRLVSNAKCPLGDEMVLFRGNAATLEHLNLTLNCELATELLRENVFTPTSHPKLQSVILKPHPNMLLANSPAYSVFLQLVEEIAPDAVVREIDFRAYRLSTPPLLSLFGKFTNLQVLALPELRLSIWDAMALLKSLPLLSDFHAQSPVLDPLPDGVTKRGLVAYVRSNYSPMAPRFRCWHLGSSQDKYLKASAVLFLLLALACPNFDFVAAGASKREILTAALEKALGMATYKKYAPRLRRLLPRGLEL